jgi:uncharacterized damage-inducible protein DinB
MHAVDVLKYGNLTLLKALDGIPGDQWETEGVCGWWSVKNIIAHLASFEHILDEVLATFQGGGPTPYMQAWAKGNFNDGEEYDLEDFIAYQYYGHKREHSAQINIFKDRFKV